MKENFFQFNKSSRPGVFCKKVFLEISQNSQGNTCARISILTKLDFINTEILAQMFSCEFCEIFKNTLSYRTPPVAASGLSF